MPFYFKGKFREVKPHFLSDKEALARRLKVDSEIIHIAKIAKKDGGDGHTFIATVFKKNKPTIVIGNNEYIIS